MAFSSSSYLKNPDRNQLIALIATALFALLVIIVLLFASLSYQWPPKDLPPQSEILFGGEFVVLGDIAPANTKAKNSVDQADDIIDAGEKADASQLISTEEPSPMTVKKREEKQSGPTKEELAEIERRKREQEKAKQISRRVSFSKNGSSETVGQTNGNSTVGVTKGSPGHTLTGRNLESWGKPMSRVDGTVVIEVRVNPKGYVISASYVSGSGSAAASTDVRRSCENASRQSRFSVAPNLTTDQVGTITWKFE